MKKVFVRVGYIVEFTEDEIKQLKSEGMSNTQLNSILLSRGEINNESYIPEDELCSYPIDFFWVKNVTEIKLSSTKTERRNLKWLDIIAFLAFTVQTKQRRSKKR